MSTPIAVTGNVGSAEMRFTSSGKAALNLSVAVNRRRFNKQTNEWEDAGTDWYRATLWGAKAEAAVELVTKGTRVIVTGDLESREWDNREGVKQTSWEIRAQEIGIVPRAASGGGSRPTQQGAQADDPWATAGPAAGGSSFTDEPPF